MLTIMKPNLINGKVFKVHSLPRTILTIRISKLKMHMIFVRKDYGKEGKRKDSKWKKN